MIMMIMIMMTMTMNISVMNMNDKCVVLQWRILIFIKGGQNFSGHWCHWCSLYVTKKGANHVSNIFTKAKKTKGLMVQCPPWICHCIIVYYLGSHGCYHITWIISPGSYHLDHITWIISPWPCICHACMHSPRTTSHSQKSHSMRSRSDG